MKTRENTSAQQQQTDDLWTQRSLSSFQTFARNQQENNKLGAGDSFGKTSPGGGSGSMSVSANSANGNGNGNGSGNGSLNGFHYNEHSILSSSSSNGSSSGSASALGSKNSSPATCNVNLTGTVTIPIAASTLPRLNGKGNQNHHNSSYCYINGSQEIIPLSLPMTPMSQCEFSVDAINGSINGNGRPHYQKHNHHSHGTFPKMNGLSKAKPVPIPMLLFDSPNVNAKPCNIMTNGSLTKKDRDRDKHKYIHSRSLSHEDHTSGFKHQNQLSVMPQQPLTSYQYAFQPAHSHSHSYSYSSNSYTSTDSTATADTEVYNPHPTIQTETEADYVPHENDVVVLDFEIKLVNDERRFGFSVIGGMDEGFPPCIDEVSPGSPADKADLEVGDEILEVNGRSLEDATHTEVISHIHQCIRSRTICLRVKRRSGNKLALDLASQSNVQDAFVIAVEQQARERLEKLSALKRIKPVDMTKLSHQLSEVPSGSGGDTAELNGLIEAATGSPIYVTSVPELSSSQVALHRALAGSGGGGGGSEYTRQDKRPSLQSTSPISGLSVSASSGGGKSSTAAVAVATTSLSNKSPVLISNGVRQKTSVSVIPSLQQDKVKAATPSAQQQLSSSASTSSSSQIVPNRVGIVADKPRTTTQIKPPYKETAIITSKPTSLENITGSQESIEGAKSTRSGVGGRNTSKSSSRESVVDQSREYANMINMVEWSNEGREMAVDVPDTFIPRNKTPPRYPPTSSAKAGTLTSGASGSVVCNKADAVRNRISASGVPVMTGNGSSTLPTSNGAAGKPIPPPRISDKDSWANNNNTTMNAAGVTAAAPPHVLPRTILSPNKTTPDLIAPSTDQADRIRKYQEELRKRREQEELHAKEQEFLRTSLRGSKKLQQLESLRNEQTPSPQVLGFVNDAYETVSDDYISPAYVSHQELFLKKPVGISELVASLQRVQEALKKNGMHLEDTVSAVGVLMQSPEFQQVLAVHNKVQDVWCFNSPPTPISAHSQQFVQECLGSLLNCSVPEAIELIDLLSRVDFEGLLYAHDKIAERERLLLSTETPLNFGESVDDFTTAPRPAAFIPDHQPHQPDDHIKVVRIEKTQDPLGATVRNEGDAVVIGRIVKGGAAERSGLLHEGDEVLEVNGIEMRGKTVNEVCDILSRMTGTLTFLIVPTPNPQLPAQRRDVLVHVRAFFDYDPEDDIYVPCRELGIAFSKGDVLHVISQDDANWWQAHREGEEDQALAGLIPSKSFQEQREAVKQSLLGESESREKQKRGTLLCAKTHKKKKKKIPYSTAFNDDFDAEEIPTYEEVALYYPRSSFKRPVVLIGPPNIGRHELRQRLMQESERFAAAVPHTSRTRKEGELDGQDYHFITRAQFESDILSRKFVEHGEFEKAYYGTSLDAIRSVVNIGKICVLNLHPQSLKILRSSDLKPYIVFIAPPPLERLKQMRISRGEAYKEDELIDIIEKAREMEDKYGHFFDLVIINNDIERTYYELVQRINYIEREPQWVSAQWLK